MTPGEPLANESPSDALLDDAFDDLLAQYDEAIAARRSLAPPSEPPSELTDSAPPEVSERIRLLQGVLRSLDRDRRQGQTPPSGAAPAEQPFGLRDTVRDDGRGRRRELGRFQILREIGSGGWGVVYLAWDPKLLRNVALKVPRPESLVASDHRRRFLREAQAAAGLNHPGIVTVYEVGEIGPIWYIASAYCEGSTLASWLAERNGPVPARCAAELVAALAEAMHYTHRRGIVHRDLKPSNILLPRASDEEVDLPFAGFNQPKITDFGLAKLLEQPGGETRSGLLLGTPAYMAPEQAEGRLQAIGPATDVYSLGVILYELLTGQVPFAGESEIDTLRQIGIGEPVAPSRIRFGLSRDLEAICLKCLDRSPARRYPHAEGLAQDLRRFLDGQPTLARPLSRWQRAVTWSRRRPALAALAGVILLVMLGLPSLGLWYVAQMHAKNIEMRVLMEDAVRQRQLAEQGERRANRQAYAALMGRADSLWHQGQSGLLAELLGKMRPDEGEEDLRGFAWYYLWRLAQKERFLRGHRFPVNAVAFSPDGRRCMSGGDDGSIKLWDVTQGSLIARSGGHSADIRAIAFSPDGLQIASASHNLASPEPKFGEVILRDAADGHPFATLTGPMVGVNALAYTSDGRSLLLAGAIENGAAGGVLRYDRGSHELQLLLTNPRHFTSLAVSDDGRQLAAACGYRDQNLLEVPIEWLDLRTGERKALASVQPMVAECLAFSPDGNWLAVGGWDGGGDFRGTVRLWNLTDGSERPLFIDETGGAPVRSLTFSRDGQTLWIDSQVLETRTSMLRQLDVASGGLLASPHYVDCIVSGITFSPDGQTLALACHDHLVRLWEVGVPARFRQLRGHPNSEAWSVAFSPLDGTLASSGDDHLIQLWDPVTGQERATLTGHTSLVSQLAYSLDGRLLASGSYDKTVRLWDTDTGSPLGILEGHAREIRCVAFSPDGRTLASAGKDRVVKVWDVATGQQRFELSGHVNQIRCLAFSPDGKRLVSAGEDRTIRIWDPATGDFIRQFDEASEVWSLAFTRDGRFLASGNRDGIVKVWEFASGEERSVLRGHLGSIRCVSFSPDGQTLASAGSDRSIRLWQAETGHELLSLTGQPHEVHSVAFADDGQTLAAALHDGSLRLFSAPITP